MTDLDARVAAICRLSDTYYTTNTLSGFDFKAALRAELQKPALHEPVSDQEAIDAIRACHLKVTTESMIDMRRTLESFLQGRAQPADKLEAENRFEHYVQNMIDHAPEPLRRLGEYLSRVLDEDEWATAERMILGVEEIKQPAQEEITDAELLQLWRNTPAAESVVIKTMNFARAAIRASKGEKT